MSRPLNTTSLCTTSDDYKIATDREITAAEAKAKPADHQDAVDDKHNQSSMTAPTLLALTLAYCHNEIDYLLLTSKFSSSPSSSTSVPVSRARFLRCCLHTTTISRTSVTSHCCPFSTYHPGTEEPHHPLKRRRSSVCPFRRYCYVTSANSDALFPLPS
ncbi:hypothetical protein EV421DRAFT_1127774 [Armillaria borealis]|uniref:Uncharacterized protein n=1 Tax=Armillaria borealis TaxID=47425 RepID=A0AA39IBV0_9AGAR|nr:hypothetical protein EV421DRAFT_1127774 [Armillaria borealis]